MRSLTKAGGFEAMARIHRLDVDVDVGCPKFLIGLGQLSTELLELRQRSLPLDLPLAPELFDTDDEVYAILLVDGDIPAELEEKARLAADTCPEFAIEIED